jgi:hypothetical protein
MFRSNSVIRNRVAHAGISALFGVLALAPGAWAAPDQPANDNAQASVPAAPPTAKPAASRYDLSAYDADRLHRVQDYIGADDDVHENLISAREALAIARSGHIPDTLGANQRKLVELVVKAQEIPIGRALTEQAAAQDIWLCIDNNVWGGGYYKDDLGLLTLELKDNGNNHGDAATDFTGDEAWARNEAVFQQGLYHELTHFYQFRIHHSAVAPPGVRSADAKLWELGIEAQAELTARVAMRQHAAADLHLGRPLPADDAVTLRAEFAELLRDDNFHKDYYEVAKGRLDDGATLDAAQYIEGMGTIPGQDGNFLEGSARGIGDIYASTFALPDARYPFLDHAAAPDSRAVDIISRADLEARGRIVNARMIETPDGQFAVIVLPTPLGIEIEQFKKLAGPADASARYEAAEITQFDYPDLSSQFLNVGLTVGYGANHCDLHIAIEDGRMRVSLTRDDPSTGQPVFLSGDPLDTPHPHRAAGPPRYTAPAWRDAGRPLQTFPRLRLDF